VTQVRSPVRIGFYSDATRFAGAEIALGNLLESLGPHVQATVIGTCATIVERLSSHRPGTTKVVLAPAQGVRGIIRHRNAFTRLDLDILQANLTWMPSCRKALVAAMTIPRLRVVAVEHLPLQGSGLSNRVVKHLTSRGLSAHVAVGKAAARIIKQAAGAPTGSIRTIYNGVVDPGTPAPRSASAGPPLFGCLARLDRVKGLDVLLDALAKVPDARVVIAGEGDERAALQGQAFALGISGRVDILEWTDDPGSLLTGCDGFVLPSRAEGFPLSILEAMLAGLPVVATDVGSVREAVVDGETGFVVPSDDATALARAMRRLATDTDLRRTMGKAGRARALERFSIERMARAYEELYEQLLGAPTEQPSRAESRQPERITPKTCTTEPNGEGSGRSSEHAWKERSIEVGDPGGIGRVVGQGTHFLTAARQADDRIRGEGSQFRNGRERRR
jgi:glycosyltransferase involved in cell wall biosynthesis